MEHIKHGGDAAFSVTTVMGILHTLPEVVTTIAGLLSIVWFVIRIYEWYTKKRVME